MGSPGDATRSIRPGLLDPLPRDLHRLLRRAVLDHATSERRRVYSPVIHVGLPGRLVAELALNDQRLDHALRTDALEALLARPDHPVRATAVSGWCLPFVWLTRRGLLDVQDIDLLWASAASSAAAELGCEVPMVVVTRQGWCDPRTGTTRTWRRLRAPRP